MRLRQSATERVGVGSIPLLHSWTRPGVFRVGLRTGTELNALCGYFRVAGLRAGVGLGIGPEPRAVVESVEDTHVFVGQFELEHVEVLRDSLG